MLSNVGQVARVLAELIQHELTDGLARRLVPHAAAGATGAAPSWHSRFSRLALELIAVTTSAGGPNLLLDPEPHPDPEPDCDFAPSQPRV